MKTVGILVFDDVEIETFADAGALFSAADDSTCGSSPVFRTLLLAQTMQAVRTDAGFRLEPQKTLRDHPPLDVLLIPGGRGRDDWPHSMLMDLADVLFEPQGKGIRRERHNIALLHWMREQSLRVESIVGICSGTALLAESGLLSGCHATTHPSLVSWMQTRYPEVLLAPEEPLVDAGQIVTATGWKAAFEASLCVIAKMCGLSTALSVVQRVDPRGTWIRSIGGAAGLAGRLFGNKYSSFTVQQSETEAK